MPAAEGDGSTVPADLDAAKLRRWLRRLDSPHELAVPELIALLAEQQRLPAGGSPVAVGQAAARLLTSAIDRLRAPTTAPLQQQMPYLVLKTCFLDGAKAYTAAAKLGISDRQLTRERNRALQLLQAELMPSRPGRARDHGSGRTAPIPRITGFLPRPAAQRALAESLASARLVHLDGPKGVGKTSLAAEHVATLAERTRVVWCQVRAGLNDNLAAFLFDLVQALRSDLSAQDVDQALTAFSQRDPAFASRVVLHALRDARFAVVLDDYHLADADPMFGSFLDEALARIPGMSVITLSRRRERSDGRGVSLHVEPLTPAETVELLGELRATADDALAERIHEWTGGLPQLIKFAVAWLKTASDDEIAQGMTSLMELDAVQDFLLDSITDLIDPEDRLVLGAASIFRDRFTDDALAFVSRRSRGQVLDTSRRLLRYNLATRGHSGEVAFFHASVRDYVEARLPPDERADLHQRAAVWYHRNGDPDEARHHETRGRVDDLSVDPVA